MTFSKPFLIPGLRFPSGRFTHRHTPRAVRDPSEEFRVIHKVTGRREMKYLLYRWFGATNLTRCEFGSEEECVIEDPIRQITEDIIDSDRRCTALIFEDERAFILLDGMLERLNQTATLSLFVNPNSTAVSRSYIMHRARSWLKRTHNVLLDF